MTRIRLKLAAGFLAAAVALAGSGWGLQALAYRPATEGARPADKPPHASKLDLTPENSAKLLAAVRPQGNEWRHLKVHWYTDIVAARKKAAAEDKPILVFRTGGAGYNDPLGQC